MVWRRDRMSIYTSTRRTTDHGSRFGFKPKRVVLHHGATTSFAGLLRLMMPGGRTVSAHAAIADDEIVSVVPESRRSFSLASSFFERNVLSAECVNSRAAPSWALSDRTHESIARWVADVCRRHGIRPHRDGNPKTWTVIGHREVYTIHRRGYATACPGGMRLDSITRRAQQILAGQGSQLAGNTTSTPTRPKGETVTLYYYTETDKPSTNASPQPIKEWALAGESPGTSANWLTTESRATRDSWAGQHGGGNWCFLTRKDYESFRARYLEPVTISGGTVGGTSASVDLSPVLDAIGGVPTAEQNGAAARAAIVK